ncbi:MAG: NUDIX hydrolase [Oscillatoria sp. PMC 1051.18]|nr:NUDIX hydrolase [Oscillatoria sp. PMC 1050.18]MEC5029932.1 NUDIX hydrolase [Oscillatoria sp. PMC 1051.18]
MLGDNLNQHHWRTLERFLEIRSPWLTLIGEKFQDEQQRILDYWRVEKPDSAIILPMQNHQLLLPIPSYRPGLGKVTLDFPGGRIPSGQTPVMAVAAILQRELGIEASAISKLQSLNQEGWAINSSFSNQRLYGFSAEIDNQVTINPDQLGATYPISLTGFQNLLQDLTCLQCRNVLLEWWLSQSVSN